MKAWLNPDTSENEYRYVLYSWWDNLAEDERTEALIKYLVKAGIDVDDLVVKC
jgi:hypothetical protein